MRRLEVPERWAGLQPQAKRPVRFPNPRSPKVEEGALYPNPRAPAYLRDAFFECPVRGLPGSRVRKTSQLYRSLRNQNRARDCAKKFERFRKACVYSRHERIGHDYPRLHEI